MRDPKRIRRILALLEEYWDQNPDLRLGQIIINLTPERFARTVEISPAVGCFPAVTAEMADPYHVEDDEWEEILKGELE